MTNSDHILESFKIPTADNYNLPLYRLKSSGPPIVLWHGMSNSSTMFSNEESNLAKYLHSKGYDVWLANSRGTIGSDHSSKCLKTEQYWDFCIDDYAEFDCPAVIDYILKVTSYNQLSYIGFSQGVALILAALAMNDELNPKVRKPIIREIEERILL